MEISSKSIAFQCPDREMNERTETGYLEWENAKLKRPSMLSPDTLHLTHQRNSFENSFYLLNSSVSVFGFAKAKMRNKFLISNGLD